MAPSTSSCCSQTRVCAPAATLASETGHWLRPLKARRPITQTALGGSVCPGVNSAAAIPSEESHWRVFPSGSKTNHFALRGPSGVSGGNTVRENSSLATLVPSIRTARRSRRLVRVFTAGAVNSIGCFRMAKPPSATLSFPWANGAPPSAAASSQAMSAVFGEMSSQTITALLRTVSPAAKLQVLSVNWSAGPPR